MANNLWMYEMARHVAAAAAKECEDTKVYLYAAADLLLAAANGMDIQEAQHTSIWTSEDLN